MRSMYVLLQRNTTTLLELINQVDHGIMVDAVNSKMSCVPVRLYRCLCYVYCTVVQYQVQYNATIRAITTSIHHPSDLREITSHIIMKASSWPYILHQSQRYENNLTT